jgi:hypothetical protein
LIVHKILIDFIRDHKQIMPMRQFSNLLQFLR